MATVDNDLSGFAEALVAMNGRNSSPALPTSCNDSRMKGSDGVDSGYSSQISTPDSSNPFVDRVVTSGKNIWPLSPRKPKQLRPYDKQIPKLTWDRFSDLREQYAESLNQFTRTLPGCPSVLMTLQVLGEDEATAEPWVFVQCDKRVFKKINNFFKQPLIRVDFEPPRPNDRSPRLRVLVCPRKPRELANDGNFTLAHTSLTDGDSDEIFGHPGMVFDTLCGLQVMNGRWKQQATMGGIISVVDKGETTLFGMTAGHFLLQISHDEGEEETNEEFHDFFDEEESFELDLSFIKADKEDQEMPDLGMPTGAEVEGMLDIPSDSKYWSKIGKVSRASHTSLGDRANFDWALIRIEAPSFSLPNIPNAWEDPFGNPDVGGSDIFVTMISNRGGTMGILSSSWSYLMLPPGRMLIRTRLLSFSDSKFLESGDSGAWVVDPLTNRIYGHVVACDVFGRGYVVPISDAFDDIKNQLCADFVYMPFPDVIRNYNKTHYKLEAASPATDQSSNLVDQVDSSVDPRSQNVIHSLPVTMLENPQQRNSELSRSSTPMMPSTPPGYSCSISPDSGYSSWNGTPNMPLTMMPMNDTITGPQVSSVHDFVMFPREDA